MKNVLKLCAFEAGTRWSTPVANESLDFILFMTYVLRTLSRYMKNAFILSECSMAPTNIFEDRFYMSHWPLWEKRKSE